MAEPDASSQQASQDPDDDPENRRIFDEWLAEQTAKRDAFVAAACRYAEGCNSGTSGLARLPGGKQVAVVGTPDEIRALLVEAEKPAPAEDA